MYLQPDQSRRPVQTHVPMMFTLSARTSSQSGYCGLSLRIDNLPEGPMATRLTKSPSSIRSTYTPSRSDRVPALRSTTMSSPSPKVASIESPSTAISYKLAGSVPNRQSHLDPEPMDSAYSSSANDPGPATRRRLPVSLLRKIEIFLHKTDMPWPKFGRLSVRDPRCVQDLRNGRQPGKTVSDRTEGFMNLWRADHTG